MVDVNVFLHVGPVVIDFLLDTELVVQQRIMISIISFVFFSKYGTHGCALVDSSNSEIKVHTAVACHDGIDDVGVVETERVEREL